MYVNVYLHKLQVINYYKSRKTTILRLKCPDSRRQGPNTPRFCMLVLGMLSSIYSAVLHQDYLWDVLYCYQMIQASIYRLRLCLVHSRTRVEAECNKYRRSLRLALCLACPTAGSECGRGPQGFLSETSDLQQRVPWLPSHQQFAVVRTQKTHVQGGTEGDWF